MGVTISILLDTRRKKQNGKFPVKLRVTFNRKHYYHTFRSKYDLTEEEFGAVFNPKHKGEYKRIHDHFVSERKRAEEIVDSLGRKFSFSTI